MIDRLAKFNELVPSSLPFVEELYHYIEKLQVGVRSDSDAKQLKRLRQKYGL